MSVFSKGYIYLGFDDSGKWIKVGKSKNWEKRMHEIRNMNPSFTIFLHWEVDNMDFVEKKIHKHLGAKQVQSEWFDLTAADIAWIAETLDGEERSRSWIETVARMTGIEVE